MTQHLTTDTIIDYIHGELPPAEDALVLAHLQTCAPCRSAFEHETSLIEALRLRARADERELPGIVRAQIWQTLRSQEPTPLQRFAALLRPAITLPTAAILVLALYFASPLGHPTSAARTVDANYYLEQHAAEQIQNPLGERNVSSPILETTEASATSDSSLGTRTAAAAALDAVE
jgi:anti-sigma factor RsiW